MSEPSQAAKANSKIYMADVHNSRKKKNVQKTKKFKVNRGPLPMGYGFGSTCVFAD